MKHLHLLLGTVVAAGLVACSGLVGADFAELQLATDGGAQDASKEDGSAPAPGSEGGVDANAPDADSGDAARMTDTGVDSSKAVDGGEASDADSSEAGDASSAGDAGDASGSVNLPVQLSSWAEETCALLAGGEVYCWGLNDRGQLGDGTTTTRGTAAPVTDINHTPLATAAKIAVGYQHACAILSTGATLCWGDETYGESGVVSPDAGALTPFDTGLPQWMRIAARGWSGGPDGIVGGFTCGVDGAHRILCLGANNDVFALGHAPGTVAGDQSCGETSCNPSASLLGGDMSFLEIALDDGGGCGVTMTGGVSCWGWNLDGELANGSTTSQAALVSINVSNVASLAAGHSAVCALGTEGSLTCWGRNYEGEFGTGGPAGASLPTAWGGASFGPVSAVAVGQRHSCAIRAADQTVWCTGWNNEGELGDGTLGGDGSLSYCLACDSTPVQVKGPSGVGVLTGAVERTAGYSSTCARTANGSVYCWGANDNGTTGHPPNTNDDVTDGDGVPCAVYPSLVTGLP